MLKLYEIPEIFNNFLALCDDPEADLEDMEQALQVIEGDFAKKMEACGKFIESSEMEEEDIEQEITRLRARQEHLKCNRDWLKGYMLAQMEKMGKDEVRSSLFTFKKAKNPVSVVIHNQDKIPAEFFRVVPEKRVPDKTAIKQAILNGTVMDGGADILPETRIITALLHDVCKADFYVPKLRNVKEYGVWKQVMGWEISDKMPLGHGEKSVILIMRFIKLTDEELMAIRWHMAGFDASAKDYSGSMALSAAVDKYPLITFLHTADLLASNINKI